MPRSAIPDRRPAIAGETFFVRGELARALIGTDEGCCEVFPKSAGKSGQWICISCTQPLAHNWDKDAHCEKPAPKKSALVGDAPEGATKARHVLAWRSFDSGKIEEP